MIASNRSEKNGLLDKKGHYESLLLAVSRDPMLFYNMGQKALVGGDRRSASKYFERACREFPEGNPYKEYSLKLLKRIANDTECNHITK
jgi:outer membrane protein assembly factor BamD (BamD/ComL family)